MQAENEILFFGDTHGGFEHCLAIVEQARPHAVVFLGDLEAKQPLHIELEHVLKLTEVWWIHGNHDTDNEQIYDNLFASELADRNLSGRVVEIAGRRIAGLGGVFRGKIWIPHHCGWNFFSQQEYFERANPRSYWRGGISLKQRSSIFPEEYMQLRTQKSDILVCHEAPSCNKYGFAAIDRLARQLGVHTVFHGHHHDVYDYSPHFEHMQFKTYAVGFRGVTNLAGKILRPGDMDGLYGDRVVSRNS